MSITAFVGVPGSGKSLHVMSELYWACRRRDALVMTNFDVTPPRGARATMHRLPEGKVLVEDVLAGVRDWIAAGHVVTHEGQILVVIDEAQISFNNRSWQEAGRDAWIRLFIQHRKLGMRYILVVQSLDMLDKQIRALVEVSASHVRANSYGIVGDLVTLLCLGRPLCHCTYRLPYFGNARSGIIGREFILGRKRYFRMYDTHQMFTDEIGLDVWSSGRASAPGDNLHDSGEVSTSVH